MNLATATLVCIFLLLPGTLACAGDASFQTPSGNIHCSLYETEVGGQLECEISEFTPSSGLPPMPDDCYLDYGNSFALETKGTASMTCASDTIRNPEADRLAYGQSISVNGITCVSEQTGLTCTNESGHGLLLSKAKQKLF